MAKETVYSDYAHGLTTKSIIGCLIIHPRWGTGLITGIEEPGVKWDRTEALFHILWGDNQRAIYDLLPWSILMTCRIIRPDEGAVEWGSWDDVTKRT